MSNPLQPAHEPWNGALADYRRAIEIQPDYPIALAHFADTNYQAGDLAGALEDFEQLIQLTPNDSRAIYNAACIYACLGQVDSVLQRLRRAIALKPTWRDSANADSDFDALRAEPAFMALITPAQRPRFRSSDRVLIGLRYQNG
jgi:tetratricopeptide (TPR) repeat protein